MKITELKFEIEYPAGTWNAVTPTVEDVVFVKQLEKPYQFYRESVDTDFLFLGADYTFLNDIEVNDHCAVLNLRIQHNGTTAYTGRVRLQDADFDNSLCQIKLKTSIQDNFTCLSDNMKTQVNMLDNSENYILKPLIGEIETLRCPPASTTTINNLFPVNPPVQDSCQTESDGWTLVENHFTFISPNGASPPWGAEHYSVWKRQRVTSPTPPPGDNWSGIGGNVWVRPIQVEFNYETSGSPPTVGGGEWHQYFDPVWAETPEIDNGNSLKGTLEYILTIIQCPLTIISNFFNINPDGTAPVNDEYTAAGEKLRDVLIYQKSDVKRSQVSNNATIGRLTMAEIFEWLAPLKVYPSIDGNILRIEHITYYLNKPLGIDLDLPIYERWVKRFNGYSYRNDDSPRYETTKWSESTNNAEFDGLPIDYGANCSSKESDTVNYTFTRVVADLATVVNFPELFSDDGFVLVNAIQFNGEYYADVEQSALTGGQVLNGHLSIPNIHDHYNRAYAYQSTGVMNGDTTTFDSVRPNRRATPVTLEGWCLEDYTGFNPNVLANEFGRECTIEKLRYSARNGTITFDLIF